MNSVIEIDNFIKAIKMRRKSLGLTQKGLADKLGWARDKYARMENRKARITFIDAYRISSALGVGLSDAINLNVDRSNSSYNISFKYV
tara:strand:+ start:277 stop:540 length:264 start_codon:yes stop_codon:yes gene_type:complete